MLFTYFAVVPFDIYNKINIGDFIRLHKYDISVTLNMKLPIQDFVHSPYPNVTIISFKRSQHVYLMILINSTVLKYVNTFSCYIH